MNTELVKDRFFELLGFVAIGVAVWLFFFILKTFFFQVFIVPTGSMKPTINENQFIIAQKCFDVEKLQRGDIVVFNGDDGQVFVKRVVGLPGDTIKENLDESIEIVNQKDTWGHGETDALDSDVSYPVSIGEDEVWVMGDNREDSKDSRAFGPIKKSDIIGIVRL